MYLKIPNDNEITQFQSFSTILLYINLFEELLPGSNPIKFVNNSEIMCVLTYKLASWRAGKKVAYHHIHGLIRMFVLAACGANKVTSHLACYLAS